MISFETKGSFDATEKWLKQTSDANIYSQLEKYGRQGVDALAAATPTDTGETANSWYYEIIRDATSWSIVWGNNHVEEGRPIAVLIQYGHGTRNGGYVEGRDYINPALKPIFDRILNDVRKVVTTS